MYKTPKPIAQTNQPMYKEKKYKTLEFKYIWQFIRESSISWLAQKNLSIIII